MAGNIFNSQWFKLDIYSGAYLLIFTTLLFSNLMAG